MLRFNAEAEQRNPVLLTGQLLDLTPKDSLRSWLDKRIKARGKKDRANSLDTLCALRLELPDTAWRAVREGQARHRWDTALWKAG